MPEHVTKKKKNFTSKTVISKIQIFSCVNAVNGIRFVCLFKEQYGDSMRMKHGAGFSVAEARLALSSSALFGSIVCGTESGGKLHCFLQLP